MKIVLLSDYYYPTIKSGSIVIKDLATELTRLGHKPTVITFSDSQNKKFTQTYEEGITVIRIRANLRKHGMIGRLLAEINYSSLIIKTLEELKIEKFDGAIVFSPSIFYFNAIKMIKSKFNIKTYLIVRDIFPKWLLDAELIKEGLLYKFFKRAEEKLYKQVDFIGIESKKDLDYFKQYIDGKTQLEVLDNWGSASDSQNIEVLDHNPLPDDLINIIYGGNMADAQDLYTLLKKLDDSIMDNKAMLTLIGAGHQLEKIQQLMKEKRFKNVQLLKEVKQETYLSILKKADIGLVSLNSRLKSNNFPLKMMGYIQQAKPILASVNRDNEIIDIIEKNDVGVVFLAGDKNALNNNLSLMISNKQKLKQQGINALKLFEQRFTVNTAVEKILLRFKG